MSQTLASRVAWAALLSACLAAVIAAAAASFIADAFLRSATDDRLLGVATELAKGLDRQPPLPPATVGLVPAIEAQITHEEGEATSNGIEFAVYGAAGLLGGNPSLVVPSARCGGHDSLRVCAVHSRAGLDVVAGSFHQSHVAPFALATCAATALAALVAWLTARQLARRAVDPLTRLQGRIVALQHELTHGDGRAADLGPDEGVTEVDELRRATSVLLIRMHDALGRATRFASDAAHELRTPLTSLRAELELLAEHDVEDENVRRAVRKVEQLHALAERLLVLALPDTPATFDLVSLRDVIDEAIANLAPEQRERVTFSGDIDVVLRGDEAELGIVVSNGLSNALKFGTLVRAEIVVAAERATLAIDDDGPGISPNERESMFSPFTRSAAAHGVPGHGLGLALVAHVARRHGGEARLVTTSLYRHGTRLEVLLPRVAPAA